MFNSSLAGQALITEEQAESVLQPYFDTLNRCIDDGWEAWKKDYAPMHHKLDARARAAIVFCEIAHRAENAFFELANVKVLRRTGTITIFIGEQITLRFKKMGKKGRCSNIITKTQALFLAQLQLPGMLDGTLVHAGYELDALQQEIVRKAVVCQLDNQVLWQIQIAGPAAMLIVMPPQSTPPIPSSEPRFVAKAQNQEKPAEAEGGSA
ncbi:hypothetical protein [Terracidiphilus gabretensis]|uniref:hypothetical protein n=1 Tax=Terracidiphilus gabretensis TaxID=1577687 RepID=UPI00071C09AF|nr:hypothetical protein [Terracidiphilus gabretensis]